MKYETLMEVDLEKLKNNTISLNKSYSDYKYKIVDLKDNAHGLGLNIINTMHQNGINYCLVGPLKDALKVRSINHEIPILVEYFVDLEEIYDCINNNITITINSLAYLRSILTLEHKDELKVQILIDNGSNLQGIKSKAELSKVIELIEEHQHLKLEGIYSCITSLGIEDEYYYQEINKFYEIIQDYLNQDLIIHLNEPIMYHAKQDYINGIRFDLSILGIEENINDDFFTNLKIKSIIKKYNDLEFPSIDLELIFNLTSEVMGVRHVKKGTLIGRNYLAKEDIDVAVIPIGHKDGITKAIKFVGIKNYRRDVLTDEIDYIVAEVTPDVKVKDKVYILNEEREIYDFIAELRTNRYYLMSILNRNVKRVYINAEENISIL